jgi:catechol 2,3-dioxygenase-like lactoylglutathione lyase family enzyme
MAEFPAPAKGIALTHFIVASDVDRARRFYADVLGGEVLREGEPSIIALANSWIIINTGGPPTDDKPTVTDAPDAARPRPHQQLPQHPRRRHPRCLRPVARPRRAYVGH